MATQANNQVAQPPTQVTPAATPPQQNFVVSKCSKNRTDIVKVLRPTGIHYAYEYSQKQNDMIPHVCTCQPTVTEASLQPLYSMNSVIFVFNTVTQSIEQYNYNFETDTFEQLENTGLVYNPALVSQSYLIVTLVSPQNEQVLIESNQNGSLRKQAVKDGGYKIMAPSKVLTSMAKSLANSEYSRNTLSRESNPEKSIKYDDKEDSESESDEDQEYKKYIGLIAPFVRMTCAHSSEVIIAFNYSTEKYESFSYCDTARKFVCLECVCTFDVMEHDLIPKYGEYGPDKEQFVLHVHNLYTNLMEQYEYCPSGFKQVHYPELVYNPSKTNNSSIILCIGGGNIPMIVLMRDSNGRFKKEKFNLDQSSYGPLGELPVKSFLVQRKEAAKKKKEAEKAKKRAQRAQEQVTEKPAAVVKSVDAQKEAPFSIDAAAHRAPVKAVKKTDTPRALEPVYVQRAPVVEPKDTTATIAIQRAAAKAEFGSISKKTQDDLQRLNVSKEAPAQSSVAQKPTAHTAIVKEDEYLGCGYKGNILDAVKNTLSAARALSDARKNMNNLNGVYGDSTDAQKHTAHRALEELVQADVSFENVKGYIAHNPTGDVTTSSLMKNADRIHGTHLSNVPKLTSSTLRSPQAVNKPARIRIIRSGPLSDELRAELRSIVNRYSSD